MTIETALFSELTGDISVSAKIGDRLYPDIAPRSASKPYVIYTDITSLHVRHMTGGSGLARRRFQFDLYSLTKAEVVGLYDAIREALDNFIGDMGTENLSVRRAMLVDEDSSAETTDDGSESHNHKKTMDFEVWYNESVT